MLRRVFGRKAPEKPRLLKGVFAAAVTPRRAGTCEIDLGAALEVIDWLCGRGVQGLALLGSTGEFVHFASEERTRLVHLGVKRSRVPVLVNVSHTAFDQAVQLGRAAADAGAAGLLVMPPYYFHYGPGEVAHFYQEYARELRRQLPVFLYNIPLFAPAIPLNVVLALLETGQFAGVKDSGGDWPYLEALCAYRREREFLLLVGNDGLFLPARRAGADGVISGVSAGLPELLLGLDQAVQGGHEEVQRKLQVRMEELIEWLKCFPVPVGVKQIAGWRGLPIGPLAAPLSPELTGTAHQFQSWFAGWLPQTLQECSHA